MNKVIPDYLSSKGIKHFSASTGNLPTYLFVLKQYLAVEHRMVFPDATRMMGGRVVQLGLDYYRGLIDYSPIRGQQEGTDINTAIRHALSVYQEYEPRTNDNGKDKEEFEAFKDYIADMIKMANEGLTEYFNNVNQIEGEYQILFDEPRIDAPIMLYQDYSGGGKQIDLKCHFPLRNPVKKDGSRSWRVPKPKTEPSDNWIRQQSVYWKATKQKPALLSVSATGYHIISEKNCEALTEPYLEMTYNEVVKTWEIFQNLLKASNGSWKTLVGLVQPDMNEIARMHGPEIVKIAKQLWEY